MNGAESNISFLLYALLAVLLILVTLAAVSLVSAFLLRVAAMGLGLGLPTYPTAYRATLLANFATLMLNLAGVASTTLLNLSRGPYAYARELEPAYWFPPIYLLLSVVFGLAVTAAVFYRTVPSQAASGQLSFGDAFALAALYAAMAIFCAIVFTLCALLGVTGFWAAASAGGL
jgi:hypothetical protein